MSDDLAELQNRIVDAVQSELTRFSKEVASEISSIRGEIDAGAAAHSELQEQVITLADAIEASHGANTTFQTDLQRALEQRLNEFGTATKRRHEEINDRLGRVVDEANNGIVAAVETAARPLMRDLEDRQTELSGSVDKFHEEIDRLDERATTIVGHINEVTGAVEGRLDEISREVVESFDERHAAVVARIDEVSAAAARQQSEVAKIVADRVETSEVRVNEKIVGLE
ncbi:MAG: hypothetical protein AAGF91_16820, partial [Actinomycetota bacterium]